MLSGNFNDMLYAYSNSEAKIILCDLPRSTETKEKFFAPYGALEKLKDGQFMVQKYVSRSYVRDFKAHVIVFSNSVPDPGQWSADRLNLIHLSEPPVTVHNF
jgi:hypothetical protein